MPVTLPAVGSATAERLIVNNRTVITENSKALINEAFNADARHSIPPDITSPCGVSPQPSKRESGDRAGFNRPSLLQAIVAARRQELARCNENATFLCTYSWSF
jgi:hypothetical protein